MIIHKGGDRVAAGSYWDMRNEGRIEMARSAALPGSEDRHYVRASSSMMVLAAPVAGLIFIFLLPFISLAWVAGLAGGRIFYKVAKSAVQNGVFSWKPLESYLSGRKKKTPGVPNAYANVNDILEALNGPRNEKEGKPRT